MTEYIRTCGIALCTAAIACALLGYFAGDKPSGRMFKVAAGGYIILIIINAVTKLDSVELNLDIDLPVSSAVSATAEDTLITVETAKILQEKLISELNNHNINIDFLEVSVVADAEGYIYCEKVELKTASSQDQEQAAEIIYKLCEIQPVVRE